jgi:hypothetical protein
VGTDCWSLLGRPARLATSAYRDFLLPELPKLLIYVLLAVRARMWYKHDGASAHCSRAVLDVLNNTCHDGWIGRGGPIVWLPCSPDFSLLHVGTPKEPWCVQSYRQGRGTSPSHCGCLSGNLQQPRHLRMHAAVGGPWWDMSRRALNLVEGILSTCYKCDFPAIPHKLNIFGYILMWTFSLFWHVEFLHKGCRHLSLSFR